MVIQVTQSDEDESKKPSKPSKSRSSHKDHHRRRKDDRNEAMEEDGEEETNNDVDHRYIHNFPFYIPINIASGSEANMTTPCEMEFFNFLWLIWVHYLPLPPT